MKKYLKYSLLLFFVFILPASCFAETSKESNFHTYASIISYTSVVLYITSAISIKQYFFLGSSNQTNFQIFNLIFAILFYLIALPFLVNEKEFYVGFEQLSASGCLKKFFLGDGVYSWLQWLVIAAMVFNILYIRKYHDA